MKEPAVSVIIPVYNKQEYLEKCLSSVINQTYSNIEIIIINDGSTDNSLSICRDYAKKDSRIMIFDKENEGVSKARNLGIAIAKGKWLFFLDADDFLDLGTFSYLLNIGDVSKADVVYLGCREWYLDKMLGERKSPEYKEYSNLELFLNNTRLSPASACLNFIKRDIIIDNDISFNESMEHNEDGLFVYSAYCHAKKFSVLNKSFYNIVLSPNSVSRKPMDIKAIKDNLLFLSELCDYVRKYELINEYRTYINKMSKYFFIASLYYKDFSIYKHEVQNNFRILYFNNRDVFDTSFFKIANLNINIVLAAIKVKHIIKRVKYTN